jgi:CubicO group peptidase (beta-lactamase class C family)
MWVDFNSLRRVVLAACDAGTIPGGVIAVGHLGKPLFIEGYGHRQIYPRSKPATADTIYDLASLTKALVTAPLAMQAVAEGLVDLDAPVGRYLPCLAGRSEVTLRGLLSHSAGFPAHRRFYESVLVGGKPTPSGRLKIVDLAAAEPFVYQPGSQSVYSDLGFILLGACLEHQLGDRLDNLAKTRLFAPLGLSSLRFIDLLERGEGLGALPIAPTENTSTTRGLVEGEVHDLNAYAMGGIAGHAGLFGNATEVLHLCLALAAAYHGRGIFAQETVRTFFKLQGVPKSTWRLGFDGPSPSQSLAGERLAKHAVGHLAFTGCSFWMDPETETCVVFLSNRIHPAVRDDPHFRALRPAVMDAALAAIGYGA